MEYVIEFIYVLVTKVTSYGLDNWGSFSSRDRNFSLHHIQTSSGLIQPASATLFTVRC